MIFNDNYSVYLLHDWRGIKTFHLYHRWWFSPFLTDKFTDRLNHCLPSELSILKIIRVPNIWMTDVVTIQFRSIFFFLENSENQIFLLGELDSSSISVIMPNEVRFNLIWEITFPSNQIKSHQEIIITTGFTLWTDPKLSNEWLKCISSAT